MEEYEIIKNWLYEKFGLICSPSVDKRNNKVSVKFNTHESKKLASLLSPYIPDFMRYKIEGILSYTPRVRNSQTDNAVGDDIVQV